jgi:hypothetical protein
MNPSMLLLPAIVLPSALAAQAPAPTLGEQVRATRPVVEKLMADLKFQEALQQAQTLLPATRPAFDKSNNQTMLTSAIRAIDLGQAYRLAVETADAAGQWEKALDYAKEAKAIAGESYEAVKDPFQKMVAYYDAAGTRAQQVLKDNADRIKELKANQNLDPGEKQELDLAMGVEKEVGDDAKWSKFFQTYINAAKEETTAYDPLITVMEKKLQGEADQIAEYKAGKGDKLKWVEAVVSSPAYLEAQGDKAGKMRFLSRLAVIDPASKKVQHQIDLLTGKAVEPAPKRVVHKKK